MKFGVFLLTIALLVYTAHSQCAIQEVSIDFENLKSCIGQYPTFYETNIELMTMAHKDLSKRQQPL